MFGRWSGGGTEEGALPRPGDRTSLFMLSVGMSSGGRLEGKSYRSGEIILNDGRGLEMSVGKLGGSQRSQPASCRRGGRDRTGAGRGEAEERSEDSILNVGS